MKEIITKLLARYTKPHGQARFNERGPKLRRFIQALLHDNKDYEINITYLPGGKGVLVTWT